MNRELTIELEDKEWLVLLWMCRKLQMTEKEVVIHSFCKVAAEYVNQSNLDVDKLKEYLERTSARIRDSVDVSL